jgi:hypothetical protein
MGRGDQMAPVLSGVAVLLGVVIAALGVDSCRLSSLGIVVGACL